MTTRTDPAEPPVQPPAQQSIGQLIGNLSEQAARLVRAEIDLAKAEIAAKAKQAGIGAGMLAGAAFLGFFAFAGVITTAILGLAEALPAWLAALIVTVLLLVGTALLAVFGGKRLQAGVPPTPDAAIESTKKDVEAVKGGLSS